jgi:hypothetical protein
MDVEQIKARIRERMDWHDTSRMIVRRDSNVYEHNTGAYVGLDDLLRWIERTEFMESLDTDR